MPLLSLFSAHVYLFMCLLMFTSIFVILDDVDRLNTEEKAFIEDPANTYIHTYIHTYIRLLTTSPKGLFSANYKEKDKNKNIYKL